MKKRIITSLAITSLAVLALVGCKKKTSTENTTTQNTTTEEKVVAEHIDAKMVSKDEVGNIEYWYVPKTNKYYKDSALTQEITKNEAYIYEFQISDYLYGIHSNGKIYNKFSVSNSSLYFMLSTDLPTKDEDGLLKMQYYTYNETSNQFSEKSDYDEITLTKYGEASSTYSYVEESGKFIINKETISTQIKEDVLNDIVDEGDTNLDNYTTSLYNYFNECVGEIDPGYTNGQIIVTPPVIYNIGRWYTVDLTEGWLNIKFENILSMPSFTWVLGGFTINDYDENTKEVIFDIVSFSCGLFNVGQSIDIIKSNGEIITEQIYNIDSGEDNKISEFRKGKIIIHTNKIKEGDLNDDVMLCATGYLPSNNEATGKYYSYLDEELVSGSIVEVTFNRTKTRYKAIITFEGEHAPKNTYKENVNIKILDHPIQMYKDCDLRVYKEGGLEDICLFTAQSVNNTTIKILGNDETDIVIFVDTTKTNALLPTQESYEGVTKTLLGFSTTADGEIEYTPGASIASIEANTTLYAIWE
jgi:hypothetical protein